MLIVNDEQLRSAGIKSLSKRCPYCSKALATYPLILSDDAGLFVYHAACAAALATEILEFVNCIEWCQDPFSSGFTNWYYNG